MTPLRSILLRFWVYARQTLVISDEVDQAAVINYVRADVDFRGAKAWILILAILVASLGLNVNSTAVIIGAMLISPLMGPIIGVGTAIGITDLGLLRKSGRNLLTAMVLSILTSTIYFLISPFDDAASELLARTQPTLLDAMIAVAGGAAGAIAMVRRDRSNVVPGVAIATALMPPLCTAGYGLSEWNAEFFFGAFYLFFINSVYIAASTYVVIRLMKFDTVREVSEVAARRVKRTVLIVAIATLIPSVWTGWNMLRANLFNRKVVDLAKQCEATYKGTSFAISEAAWASDTSHVTLTVVGPPLDAQQLQQVRLLAAKKGLEDAHLDIRQATGLSDMMLAQATETMRRNVMGDIYDRTLEELATKDSIITALRASQMQRRQSVDLLSDVAREVEQIDRNVSSITYQDSIYIHRKDGGIDTSSVAYVSFERNPTRAELDLLTHWLRVRLKRDSVMVRIVDRD